MQEADPDRAVLLTAVPAGGRALAGPPPHRLLAPVPHADLVRATLAGVPGLLDDLDGDTRTVRLTLARVWCTAGPRLPSVGRRSVRVDPGRRGRGGSPYGWTGTRRVHPGGGDRKKYGWPVHRPPGAAEGPAGARPQEAVP
ncbi:aminoglycoside adenylyltransferase domain-containing protein [Streptomyces sp. NPDC101132]|uniref:aminoglycoside adenylyltransferase domain-containing protein n=1 Tax=Streptomyces sp. NPDC101132 TaxID=3366110 RepID=UPI00381AA4C8